MSQQVNTLKQANLQIIKNIMDVNQIKLEDLIEFLDLNQEPIKETIKVEKPNKIKVEKPNKIKVEKPNKINSIFTKVSSKWGDDAVGLEEEGFLSSELVESVEVAVESEEIVEQVETVEPVETVDSPWKNIVKKHNPNKSPVVVTPANTISKKLQIVTSLSEFVESIKQKKKLFVDFLIDDKAHCEHTFNGTLCPNVKRCGKIHLQRCINNLNCSHKNCPYLHMNDMHDDAAKDNFIETMDDYNFIKKNKKVCM